MLSLCLFILFLFPRLARSLFVVAASFSHETTCVVWHCVGIKSRPCDWILVTVVYVYNWSVVLWTNEQLLKLFLLHNFSQETSPRWLLLSVCVDGYWTAHFLCELWTMSLVVVQCSVVDLCAALVIKKLSYNSRLKYAFSVMLETVRCVQREGYTYLICILFFFIAC